MVFTKLMRHFTFSIAFLLILSACFHPTYKEPVLQVQDEYPVFTLKKSLLSKYLTPEIYKDLENKKTNFHNGLDLVIRSGVVNQDSSIGVYAPDQDAYKTFALLFNPIISEYHGGYHTDQRHPVKFDHQSLAIADIDPQMKHIMSTRVRVGRNLDGFPFAPAISKADRLLVEAKIVEALKQLDGELEGTYTPLSTMDEVTRQRLVNEHFLFKQGDRFLEAAGATRDWPEGRGIFFSKNKKFLVWVNEEDELRIISMQNGANILEVYARLQKAVASLEKKLTFAFDPHLGYLSSCPTNLGTAMRASVHIKIPLVSQQETFLSWLEDHKLSVRGVHGEHSESEGGVYNISNKIRLGLTENDTIDILYKGVKLLIEWENELEKLKDKKIKPKKAA